MNKVSVSTSITYGVLLILVGTVSFFRSNDVVAFIAGAVGGLLVLVALVTGIIKNHSCGYLFIASTSILICSYTGMSYAMDNSTLPVGLMFVFSATTFVVVGLSWLGDRKKVAVKKLKLRAR